MGNILDIGSWQLHTLRAHKLHRVAPMANKTGQRPNSHTRNFKGGRERRDTTTHEEQRGCCTSYLMEG